MKLKLIFKIFGVQDGKIFAQPSRLLNTSTNQDQSWRKFITTIGRFPTR